MCNDSESEFARELGPKERLLWAGQPQSGIKLRPSDALGIPFSLMWGGFAIFWETTVFLTNAPIFFMLWGIPFVLIGLYMIFGRFIVDAMQRSKMHYGVTSERIIVISGYFFRSIKSLNIETLTDVTLIEKGDKSGTITFGLGHPFYGSCDGSNWPGANELSPPSFELIESARNVYETIREAQREARKNN